ncbi:DUF4296 domain-containing protein [Winogradskyella sp. PE311]|uniref:DUF4296 domain-containing protein n=1 Tax=Winogradskyella sp. PE311 TaxID=3366943 RepID=UPI00397EAD88
MRKISVFIILSLFLACVGNDKPSKPANLIPKSDMENILHDLYIINGAKGVNRKLLEKNGFQPETYVLNKYNIDSLQFANSNKYYAFDTEVYKSIIDNVKSRLEREKEDYENQEREEVMEAKRRRDSVKKVNEVLKDSLAKILGKKKDSIPKLIQDISIN